MPIYFDLVCALVLWSGTGPLFAQEQKSEDDSTAILIRARNLRERLNDLQDEFKFMGDQVTKISVFDDLPPREKEKLLFMLPPTLADADTSHLDPMTEIKKNPHLNGPLIEMILNNVKALPNLRVGMTAKEVKKIMSVRFEFIGPPDKQRLAPNPCRKEKFIRVGHEYLVYYYLIQWSSPMNSRFIKADDTIPLIFDNEQLIGIGWSLWLKITGKEAPPDTL